MLHIAENINYPVAIGPDNRLFPVVKVLEIKCINILHINLQLTSIKDPFPILNF